MGDKNFGHHIRKVWYSQLEKQQPCLQKLQSTRN